MVKVGCSVVTVMVFPCESTVTKTKVTGGVGVAAGGGMGEKIVGGGPNEVVPLEVGAGVMPLDVVTRPLVVGKLPLLVNEPDVLTGGAVFDVETAVVLVPTGFTVFVTVVTIVVVIYVFVIYVVGAF